MRLRPVTILLAALVLADCARDPVQRPADASLPPDAADPFAPCTSLEQCCPIDELVCWSGGEKTICTCPRLWDCSDGKSCRQQAPTPPGGGDWTCTWTEFKYACVRQLPASADKGPNPQTLPRGADWICSWDEPGHRWLCMKTPPNPSNKPEGTAVWGCTVEQGTLVCVRPAPPPPVPDPGTWKCATDAQTGKIVCTKLESNGGLPPGGEGWRCHRAVKKVPTWICHGNASAPPGGAGWVCVAVEPGPWRCEKAEDAGDLPPGGGWYACVKGSAYGGTRCEKVASAPTPTPKPGETCAVGDKRWCDVASGGAWGQVACDPTTSRWKTITLNGAEVIDCTELATGKRPDTVCACFHTFFNGACCERPDCILPAGTSGQLCPPSAGTLCSPCNPIKPECQEPGAICVTTNSKETYCGRLCSPTSACPPDHLCVVVKLGSGVSNQCVPKDFSCYYD